MVTRELIKELSLSRLVIGLAGYYGGLSYRGDVSIDEEAMSFVKADDH